MKKRLQNKSKLVTTLKFVLKNMRYFFILVIFLLAYLFGKNLTLPEKELAYQKEIKRLNQVLSESYQIKANRQSFIFAGRLNANPNEGYRFIADYKTKGILKDKNLATHPVKINIWASSQLNGRQLIDSFEINPNSRIDNHESKFFSNGNYPDLLVEKENLEYQGDLIIKNPHFDAINVKNQASFEKLKPTIAAQVSFDKVIFETKTEQENGFYTLTRNNQTVGQILTSSDNFNLAQVEMKLEIVGSGGVGSYFLELKEVEDNNGKSTISSSRIAYSSFTIQDLGDMKIGTDLYQLPIAAKLKKGKRYFLGINNQMVGFNLINTIKIGKVSGDKNAAEIIRGAQTFGLNDIYLKIFAADHLGQNGQSILADAVISDLGQGRGMYRYQQKSDVTDFFDIDQILANSNSQTLIFYDNISQGISGVTQDNNSFIYKFDTIYPFKNLQILLCQPSSEFVKSLAYWSYDQKNWQIIADDLDEERVENGNAYQLKQNLVGDGKANQVFLKVTYDPEDLKNKSDRIFGIRNLRVNAELEIK